MILCARLTSETRQTTGGTYEHFLNARPTPITYRILHNIWMICTWTNPRYLCFVWLYTEPASVRIGPDVYPLQYPESDRLLERNDLIKKTIYYYIENWEREKAKKMVTVNIITRITLSCKYTIVYYRVKRIPETHTNCKNTVSEWDRLCTRESDEKKNAEEWQTLI